MSEGVERAIVRIGGARLAYEATGSGAPVVLIHGLSGSSRWWRRNVGALAGGFRVYSIDLIGFGASRGARFVLREAAAYLALWMERLGIEQARVVGHSMGGFIAAELAADAPSRVERLVLVDAAALPFGYGYTRLARDLLRTTRRLPPDFMAVLAGDALRAGPLTIGRATRDLFHSDIRAKLRAIQTPTLVVWGAEDRLVSLDIGRRIAAEVPGAALAVIEHAGHVPMWERAERFNRLVGGFLSAPEPRRWLRGERGSA